MTTSTLFTVDHTTMLPPKPNSRHTSASTVIHYKATPPTLHVLHRMQSGGAESVKLYSTTGQQSDWCVFVLKVSTEAPITTQYILV